MINRKLLKDKLPGDNISFRRRTYRIDVDKLNSPAITETTVRMARTTNQGKLVAGHFLTYKIKN